MKSWVMQPRHITLPDIARGGPDRQRGRERHVGVNAFSLVPLTYSWLRVAAPSARMNHQQDYRVANVQLADATNQFSCVVGNSAGAVPSSSARL